VIAREAGQGGTDRSAAAHWAEASQPDGWRRVLSGEDGQVDSTWHRKAFAVHPLGVPGPSFFLVNAILLGIGYCLLPFFGEFAPKSTINDFVNRVALVAAALDTLKATHALPISTDALYPGIEYPFFLFESPGFYFVSSFISWMVDAPAYVGVGVTLALAFAAAVFAIYKLATQGGLNAYFAAGLGFLYASGPYLSLTLFQRVAFPEYVAWLMLPVSLLLVQFSVRRTSASWPVLIGALSLAAPFYLHKLIAPHQALTLGLLALTAVPLSRRAMLRLGVIGAIALLFTVPSWLPVRQGLETANIDGLTAGQRPWVPDPSLVTLFWPYSRNSLSAHPSLDIYDGRFAIQVGVAASVGFLAAFWMLLTQPRLAIARGLAIPLGLFVVYALLAVDFLSAWDVVPGPLRLVQWSGRVTGLPQFLGIILFVGCFGSPKFRLRLYFRPTVLWVSGAAFLGFAMLAAMTYWQQPALLPLRSADISPSHLFDMSTFFKESVRSNLITGRAVHREGWLAVPPIPIAVPDGISKVVLQGSVPSSAFGRSPEPLTLRVYGLASFNQRAAGQGEERTRSLLSEASLSGPGVVRLDASIPAATRGLAIECSRGENAFQTVTSPELSQRCLLIEYLATPNEVDSFIQPSEIPTAWRTRLGMGTSVIDARALPPGHYLLPTFDYGFVRIADADGASIPSYQFGGRTAIRHDGSVDRYTVSYDLSLSVLAVLAGLTLAILFAVARDLDWSPRSYRRGQPGAVVHDRFLEVASHDCPTGLSHQEGAYSRIGHSSPGARGCSSGNRIRTSIRPDGPPTAGRSKATR
jgi:hypothetical protein